MAGKSITFAPNFKNQEKVLRKAARDGYYYPTLAIKQLESLSTGAIGKNNVYIPNINDSRAHTLQMFYMYLPGIEATIESRHNTGFVVTSLILSDGYKSIGRGAYKPGIYSVSTGEQGLSVSYRKNGMVKAEDNRYVIVCESGYERPKDAVDDVLKRMAKLASRDVAEDKDFDILYSASGLKGMRQFDPIAIKDAYATSSVLSNAMIKAEKRKVRWVSDFGGSVFLTQAMAITAQQSVKLPDHKVRMYKPSTDPKISYHLAQQVGVKVGSDFAVGTSGGIKGRISSLVTKAKRIGNKDDPYTIKDGAKDAAQSGLSGVGVAGVGLFIAALPATAGALGVAGAITSGIGAMQLIASKYKNLSEKPRK